MVIIAGMGKPDLYQLYLETYGHVRSGGVLDKASYTVFDPAVGHHVPRGRMESQAMALAAEDAKAQAGPRSNTVFETEMERLAR